jgi:type II secretory pathway component PulF
MGDSLGPFNLLLLALPGIALKIAVRVMYAQRSFAAADPLRILLQAASTVMLVLAALGGTLGILGPPTSIGVVVLGWIPALAVSLVVVLMVIDRYRRGEHRALVWSVALAAERNIPLPEAARAFADEMQNDSGARALLLANSLERGQPLSIAVREARLKVAPSLRLSIEVGETLGMLAPALKQQLGESAETDSLLRSTIARMYYLYIVLLVLAGVTTFVMLKIVPVFQKMFEEFGLKLPAMTRSLINVCNYFLTHGWYISAPFILVGQILALVLGLAGVLFFVGWLPRDLPIVWRLFRRYDGALVLRSLALAVRRGAKLVDALYLIAEVYPIRRMRPGLIRAAQRAAQGAAWPEALRRERLITQTDVAVLSAAERADNLAWALEEMADSAIRRQAYWLQAALHVLYPPVVLVVAAMVAFFVVGLFLPLIALIQGMT